MPRRRRRGKETDAVVVVAAAVAADVLVGHVDTEVAVDSDIAVENADVTVSAVVATAAFDAAFAEWSAGRFASRRSTSADEAFDYVGRVVVATVVEKTEP